MIDINELRRLAQAATPGPWQFWHGWVATNIDSDGGTVIAERPTPSGGKYQARVDGNFRFIAAANPATVSELLDRLEAAESDALEQARLNGMGASREAALMAKLEATEMAWKISDETVYNLTEKVIPNIRKKLESAEKERDNANAAAAGIALQAETLQAERDALRARIKGMEQQEPVAWIVAPSSRPFWGEYARQDAEAEAQRCGGTAKAEPLYLAPGAQPAPSALAEAIIADMQAQHDSELITENDSGEALIRLDAAIAAVEDNFALAQPATNAPGDWLPIPEKHPTFYPVDLQLSDGSVLCGCVPQSDGDYWWEGPSGEVFIDPKYANVTHWRLAAAPEAKP